MRSTIGIWRKVIDFRGRGEVFIKLFFSRTEVYTKEDAEKFWAKGDEQLQWCTALQTYNNWLRYELSECGSMEKTDLHKFKPDGVQNLKPRCYLEWMSADFNLPAKPWALAWGGSRQPSKPRPLPRGVSRQPNNPDHSHSTSLFKLLPREYRCVSLPCAGDFPVPLGPPESAEIPLNLDWIPFNSACCYLA